MDINEITPGTRIAFGRFTPAGRNREPRELDWIVLGTEGGSALLLCEKLIACLPYHDSEAGGGWELSRIRNWLNYEFLINAFTPEERAALDISISEGGVQDRFFLLSKQETEEYLSNEEIRTQSGLRRKPARCADKLVKTRETRDQYWWLRDPTVHIDHNGYYGYTPTYCERWVRPACRIKLSEAARLSPSACR